MRKCYTHTLASNIVEIVERVLDKYDIYVPSPEDDERKEDPENEAKLYGSTYWGLLDEIEEILIDYIDEFKAEDVEIEPFVYGIEEE